MNAPVLVFTIARSRSSLVAATVADTIGAWVGTCSGERPGYPRGQMENRYLLDLQRRWFGRGWDQIEAGMDCPPKPGFREAVGAILASDGYPGGAWVYKSSAWYAPAWLDAFPGAWVVTVRRATDEIIASAKRHGGRVPSQRVIDAHNSVLDRLRGQGAMELCPSERPGDIDRLREWLTQPEVVHG